MHGETDEKQPVRIGEKTGRHLQIFNSFLIHLVSFFSYLFLSLSHSLSTRLFFVDSIVAAWQLMMLSLLHIA
jgi:hypothetical protein